MPNDGVVGSYSYLTTDRRPDTATGPGATITAPGPNSLYAQALTPAQVAKLAAKLPKNLAAAIIADLTSLLTA